MSRSNYHSGKKSDHCHFCGALGTQEHHIVPQRFGGDDREGNIVEVCEPCHKKLEQLYDKSFYEWFGINDETGERLCHRPCYRKGCSDTPTEHWRNEKFNEDLFACDAHVQKSWESSDAIEFVAEVNR